MRLTPTVTLLLVLAVADGLGPGGTTQIFRCRCIKKEKRRTGCYIETMVVYPVNSHCSEIEIIATLKKDGQKICLDPEAPWLKEFFRRTGLSKYLREQTKPVSVQFRELAEEKGRKSGARRCVTSFSMI